MQSNTLLHKIDITFVRHGTTEYNEQNRVQGSSDIPLSKKGYEDIEKISLQHCNYDMYIHSPLMRSEYTLYGILEKYNKSIEQENITESSYVTERGYGIFEGLTPNEIKQRYPVHYNDWLRNENVKGDGIESIEHVIQRIQEFIKICIDCKKSKLLVVTHSGFLYALYKYITGSPLHLKPKDFIVSFPNCCVVEFQIFVYFHYIEFNLKIEDNVIQKIIKHS